MQVFENLVSIFDNWLWGPPLILLLVGTHVFMTIRTKGIQRHLGRAIKLSVTKDDFGGGDVKPFSALATALSATIGTGNIIGVATAIAVGGPGAVFWTWITGVFGVATKYSESLLSVKYRVRKKDGMMAGGPMYVCEHGLHAKWLGVAFAIFTCLASFGIGSTVQTNSIAQELHSVLNVPTWVTGLVCAVLVFAITIGGIKSISKITSKLVPFMAIFYVLGCIVLLIIGRDTVGQSIMLILKDAFTGQAALGGFAGSTVLISMRYGIARGLFSNESGLGSAPIAHAASTARNPVRQALIASTGTFWDTIIICAMTGIVVVNSGMWMKGLNGTALSKATFGSVPVLGPFILTVGLSLFAFTTTLGWSYYSEKAVQYLFGQKAILPWRIIYIVTVFFGAIFSLDLVWNLSDIFNGLMAIPNLISVLLLSGVVAAETKRYLARGHLNDINEKQYVRDEYEESKEPEKKEQQHADVKA